VAVSLLKGGGRFSHAWVRLCLEYSAFWAEDDLHCCSGWKRPQAERGLGEVSGGRTLPHLSRRTCGLRGPPPWTRSGGSCLASLCLSIHGDQGTSQALPLCTLTMYCPQVASLKYPDGDSCAEEKCIALPYCLMLVPAKGQAVRVCWSCACVSCCLPPMGQVLECTSRNLLLGVSNKVVQVLECTSRNLLLGVSNKVVQVLECSSWV
jgi:hypothetical protein